MNGFAKTKKNNPNLEIFVLLYPHKWDFEMGYDPVISNALYLEAAKYPNLKYFDLYNCYKNKISLDGESFNNYWWSKDGHHNSKGYQLKARCIAEVIKPYLSSKNVSSSLN
jgi:lysophospholipase L1-like esterase